MSKHYLCKCNNCETIMFDENPATESNLVDIENIDGIENMHYHHDHWVCPKCGTDDYLVDYTPKPFKGVVCGHEEQIELDDDAHYVEFKDGFGDVCIHCFNKHLGNKLYSANLDDSPILDWRENAITDYYYDGTIGEFQKQINTKVCTEVYGRALEVRCPSCDYGTYISIDNMFDETHECGHCGTEFILDKNLPIH